MFLRCGRRIVNLSRFTFAACYSMCFDMLFTGGTHLTLDALLQVGCCCLTTRNSRCRPQSLLERDSWSKEDPSSCHGAKSGTSRIPVRWILHVQLHGRDLSSCPGANNSSPTAVRWILVVMVVSYVDSRSAQQSRDGIVFFWCFFFSLLLMTLMFVPFCPGHGLLRPLGPQDSLY